MPIDLFPGPKNFFRQRNLPCPRTVKKAPPASSFFFLFSHRPAFTTRSPARPSPKFGRDIFQLRNGLFKKLPISFTKPVQPGLSFPERFAFSPATAAAERIPGALFASRVHPKGFGHKFSAQFGIVHLLKGLFRNIAHFITIQHIKIARIYAAVSFHDKISRTSSVHGTAFRGKIQQHADIIIKVAYAQKRPLPETGDIFSDARQQKSEIRLRGKPRLRFPVKIQFVQTGNKLQVKKSVLQKKLST